MNRIETVSGRVIPLRLDDIDTDRIIPARYLRCVTFEGLGEHAFEDDRQQDPTHPFNLSQFQGAGILIAGRNFGCGSSREHAPQALMRWGIKAIIGESFAEIFFGNCTTNGVPCVNVETAALEKLAAAAAAQPQAEATVDLVNKHVTLGPLTFPLTMHEGARQSLVTGNWDFLGQLVEAAPQVREVVGRLPYMSNFA